MNDDKKEEPSKPPQLSLEQELLIEEFRQKILSIKYDYNDLQQSCNESPHISSQNDLPSTIATVNEIPSPSKRRKDAIIVVNKQSNLPVELPENMVYWVRCETRVREGCSVISNKDLQQFYQTQICLCDELKLTDNAESIKIQNMYQDPQKEQFISKAEQRVYQTVKQQNNKRLFEIEGYIELNSVSEDSFFFNSKYESGNLRQAFKVMQNKQQQFSHIQEQQQAPIINSEYNLYLQDDTNNDNSLTQWFYFSVRNI